MAKKDVAAIVSGAGWIASLADKLISGLRERGVSDKQIHSLVTDEGDVSVSIIVDALVQMLGSCIDKVVGVFQFALNGNVKISELIKRGQYDWHNDWITDERFPIQPHDPMPRTAELIEFDHNPTSEEVLEEFGRCGLERPTYEDALEFGAQHPEEQRERTIVFLHEFLLDPTGKHSVFVLDEVDGERWLYMVKSSVGTWSQYSVFAGIRKPRAYRISREERNRYE